MKNNLLKEDLIKIVQEAKRNSCVNEKIVVPGEMYVSSKTKRRKKIDNNLKEKVRIIATCAIVAGTIGFGSSVASTMDFATEVREEVNNTYVAQNLVGGKYIEKSEHDVEFRKYVNDLTDLQLTGLFNETSKEMQNDGITNRISNIEEVVDKMEEAYLEESGRSR